MAERWVPRPYMTKGVEFFVKRACAGLWYDPGLSKTAISLASMKIFKRERLMRAALVIAPLHPLYNSWPGEIEKWQDFNGIDYTILHGKGKDARLREKHDLYLINPDGLTWLFRQLHGVRDWPFDVLYVDEVTKFKHTRTQRFRSLRAQLGRFRRRYTLTGTPAPNGLEDIFGQVYLLDEGKALGRYITHYRLQYFDPTGFGGFTYALKKGAAAQIHKRLEGFVLRMDARDWLDLPPLVVNDVPVDLPVEARARYKQLEDHLIVQLEEGKVTAANAAVASMKCQQLANGAIWLDQDYAKDAEQRRWELVHDAKLDALVDLIEELQGSPLLVTYWFHHDLARLRKRFPTAAVLAGDPKKVKLQVDAWNRGEISVALAQPASTAWGLNLQEQAHARIALFSLFWDLEAYDQIIHRILRQGFKGDRLILHRFFARGTVDEAVLEGYKRKGKVQGRLMDALKRYAEKRRARGA